MDRRSFVKDLALLCTISQIAPVAAMASSDKPQPASTDTVSARHIPRWRGFNLQGHFSSPEHPFSGPAFQEFDFATMAGWGFNFARLPLAYWAWGSPTDWSVIREEPLREIDRAIELGQKYGIHINLNFHRIPGYCINGRELEPADLFTGTKAQRDRALDAAVSHWRAFAKRYRALPSTRLSFDLINEPPKMRSYEGYLEERYVEIVNALVAAIRQESPDRLIFADGMNIGQAPVMGIVDLGLVQSTRGYQPKAVSHYTATWVPADEFETTKPPTWPLVDDKGQTWDRARLKQEYIDKYQPLVARGVQIHVGEWGCFNKTAHAVALAWMEDCLSLWKEAGWGWSLWNLRGDFGVLDSKRQDVAYEDFNGHKLDRKMLDLLRRY